MSIRIAIIIGVLMFLLATALMGLYVLNTRPQPVADAAQQQTVRQPQPVQPAQPAQPVVVTPEQDTGGGE